MRDGYAKPPMHPVAECLISAEKSLQEYDEGSISLPSAISLCRLLSLRDVARARDRIPGIDKRISRLTEGDWKPALYELITAISYPPELKPELLLETRGTPSPDMRLRALPKVMVECKTRLEYEKRVRKFVRNWRRKQLSQIHQAIVPGSNSIVVRVEVNALSDYEKMRPGTIGNLVSTMLKSGNTVCPDAPGCIVRVEHMPSYKTVLDTPVPVMSREFWEHGWSFEEWDQWHYILPWGEIAIADADRRFATRYAQRVLICVRANELSDSAASIISALKDACKRQFKRENTGVIHILLDSRQFGLAGSRSIDSIRRLLQPEIEQVFADYSRLWRVYMDVVSQPEMFPSESPTTYRLEATNAKAAVPAGFQPPKPVLVV